MLAETALPDDPVLPEVSASLDELVSPDESPDGPPPPPLPPPPQEITRRLKNNIIRRKRIIFFILHYFECNKFLPISGLAMILMNVFSGLLMVKPYVFPI